MIPCLSFIFQTGLAQNGIPCLKRIFVISFLMLDAGNLKPLLCLAMIALRFARQEICKFGFSHLILLL
jgi:hypothetical protein